ncbi:urease accessory protein UreD [Cribrihabitans neustonicus]|uniref:urease accessory protein UreD n=1 Tax=Cribrihabitans neustonicus TaxID=1429085 RepID=UPI003B5B6D41
MLSVKQAGPGSGLDRFRSSGAMKALFPRPRGGGVEAILINTSGGLTGGDRIDVEARAGRGSSLTLTTQAAERAYRANTGEAVVSTRLEADCGAELMWLPQELILFDGCALNRSLAVDLAPDARFLMAEAVIFGRAAMGEQLHSIRLRDRIRISRGGVAAYRDGMDLSGDAFTHMARRAIGAGAGAMSSLAYAAPDAEAHLAPLRRCLPATCGVSLLAPDLLVARLLAADSFALRHVLIPILDRLSCGRLPASWRL